MNGYVCKRPSLPAGNYAILEWEFDTMTATGGGYPLSFKGTTGAAALSGGHLVLETGGWAETEIVSLPNGLTRLGDRSIETVAKLDGLLGRDTLVSLDSTYFTSGSYNHNHFDAIMFGENAPHRFEFGSEWNHREATHATGADDKVGWRHVVLSEDIHNDVVVLYVDGVEYERHTGQGTDFAYDNGKFKVLFGMRHESCNNPACHLDGELAFVRIYDKALSAAEVAALHAKL